MNEQDLQILKNLKQPIYTSRSKTPFQLEEVGESFSKLSYIHRLGHREVIPYGFSNKALLSKPKQR